MTEEIKNDIDKLDGMVKMKKCGYDFIGGCSDLRRLKQENARLKEALENVRNYLELTGILCGNELLLDTNTQRAVDVINEVLKDE